jgi:lipid-A-disaccharide synthase
MKQRIFISTGEVSGDLQGAMLVEALYRQAAQQQIELEIFALGGDRMAAAGATLLGNTSTIGSVGIVEILPYVLPTLMMQRRIKRDLRQYPPDLVVMIDYMGANIAIGNYIRQQFPNVPTVYYIAPQEWVWSLNDRNTGQIIHISQEILAIFPEEARYYREKAAQQGGTTVTWVGHPLVDRMQHAPSRDQARSALNIPPDQTVISLIPASRRQELRYLLPVIANAAAQIQTKLPEAQFWVPLSFDDFEAPIAQALDACGVQAHFTKAQGQLAIAASDLAITKSGTVNLEIALMDVPQVVLYRVNPITAWIAQHLLRFSIPFMSPTNLVTMTEIVPEFLQAAATPSAITQMSLELLLNPAARSQMLQGYADIRQALGSVGVCDRAAQHIFTLL